MSQPKYIHDCEKCTYLGTDMEGQDWYVCGPEKHRSLIRRYGDEGSKYVSSAIGICVEMTRLEKLALRMGFEFNDYEKIRFGGKYLDNQVMYISVEDAKENGPDIEDEDLLKESGV